MSAALFAPGAKEFVARYVGQAEIKDDEIGQGLGEDPRLRLSAVGGFDHFVALGAEAGSQSSIGGSSSTTRMRIGALMRRVEFD